MFHVGKLQLFAWLNNSPFNTVEVNVVMYLRNVKCEIYYGKEQYVVDTLTEVSYGK